MQFYFCGFSRQKLRLFGLNNDDVAVFDYLQRFFSSGQAKHILHDDDKYWFITYRKLVEDQITDWSIETYKRRFRYYKSIQVLDIFKPVNKSTKLYIKLNLNSLYETDEFETVAGKDVTLRFYRPQNYFNSIQFNDTTFKYYSSVLKNNFIIDFNKKNQAFSSTKDPVFTNIFKTFLKKIVSKRVFDLYLSRCYIVSNNPNFTQINFTFTNNQKFIIEKEKYNIERALCDAFLFVLKEPHVVEKYETLT